MRAAVRLLVWRECSPSRTPAAVRPPARPPVPSVEYVINYSFPLTVEDYVHRIGRTGRGGSTGTAHTLFTELDKAHAGALANVLREGGHSVPEALTRFGGHVKKKEPKLAGPIVVAPVGAPSASRMRFD